MSDCHTWESGFVQIHNIRLVNMEKILLEFLRSCLSFLLVGCCLQMCACFFFGGGEWGQGDCIMVLKCKLFECGLALVCWCIVLLTEEHTAVTTIELLRVHFNPWLLLSLLYYYNYFILYLWTSGGSCRVIDSLWSTLLYNCSVCLDKTLVIVVVSNYFSVSFKGKASLHLLPKIAGRLNSSGPPQLAKAFK